MTNRYYPRFAGKGDGFQELYEVADSRTNEAVSEKMPYHDALELVEARNSGTEHERSQSLLAAVEPAGFWAVTLPGAWLSK